MDIIMDIMKEVVNDCVGVFFFNHINYITK